MEIVWPQNREKPLVARRPQAGPVPPREHRSVDPVLEIGWVAPCIVTIHRHAGEHGHRAYIDGPQGLPEDGHELAVLSL
jgi:hypothetical protein